MQIPNKYA